jgi:peptide/nickel transport system permease protein
MTDLLDPVDIAEDITAPPARSPWRRFARDRVAMLGLVFILALILVALFAPALAPKDPNKQNLIDRFHKPDSEFRLGADDFGRDQLSRLIYGARVSLEFSFLAVAIGTVIGMPLGLAAGFLGGRVDGVMSRFNDMLLCIPPLLLLIVIAGVLGRSLLVGAFAIGIVGVPRSFRVIRAVTADVRGETYIEAGRALGKPLPRILLSDVLPNAMQPLVVQAALGLGAAVVAEASLSFLGLGIKPPTPTWGNMLGAAAGNMTQAPFLIYPPGILIAVTVLAYLFIGDGLRSAFGTTRSAVSEGM